MLAARVLTLCRTSHIWRNARNFATGVDSAGAQLATGDNCEPTGYNCCHLLLFKASRRFQPKPGFAYALENYVLKVRSRRF